MFAWRCICVFVSGADIAGPERAFPDFDYKTKWWLTVLTPFFFAAVLLLVFCGVVCKKFVWKQCGWSTKEVKYYSHAPRLLATFLLVMYSL
jgi:hypothetical protein